MKKIFRIILVILILLGAGYLYVTKNPQLPTEAQPELTGQVITDTESTNTDNNGPVGLANPASVNCEKDGGTLEIVTQADGGQIGMCHLSDGTVCEERAYMRHECPSAGTNPGSDGVVCTAEYAPVCALVHVQCIKAPCPPLEQTFSNKCMMEANSLAEFLHDGECKTK